MYVYCIYIKSSLHVAKNSVNSIDKCCWLNKIYV